MPNDQPSRGVQLRKYARLSVTFPLTFVVDGDSVTQDGNALDIGGGGMSFESPDPIEAHSLLTLCFGLRPGLDFQVRGRTISCTSDPTKTTHRHRVVFEALPADVRNAIVMHVNDAWRALLMNRI